MRDETLVGTDATSSLLAALDDASLTHLSGALGDCTLEESCELLNQQGRPAFLAHLKQLGVNGLSDRQKIANALGKVARVPPALAPGDALLFLTPWNWTLSGVSK